MFQYRIVPVKTGGCALFVNHRFVRFFEDQEVAKTYAKDIYDKQGIPTLNNAVTFS